MQNRRALSPIIWNCNWGAAVSFSLTKCINRCVRKTETPQCFWQGDIQQDRLVIQISEDWKSKKQTRRSQWYPQLHTADAASRAKWLTPVSVTGKEGPPVRLWTLKRPPTGKREERVLPESRSPKNVYLWGHPLSASLKRKSVCSWNSHQFRAYLGYYRGRRSRNSPLLPKWKWPVMEIKVPSLIPLSSLSHRFYTKP